MSDTVRGTPIAPLADGTLLPDGEIIADGQMPIATHANGVVHAEQTSDISTRTIAPTVFESTLFDKPVGASANEVRTEPTYFSDLNLDQLLKSITAGREEYELAPFFYEHLKDPETISYRQEVFHDLEYEAVFGQITTFAQAMREMRASLKQANELHYQHQRESWFVDTVELYCNAVKSLASGLSELELNSEGLRSFRDYLTSYVQSPAFGALGVEIQEVKQGLSTVAYTIQIKGPRCTVAKYEGEDDYSVEVLSTFDRFKQGAAKDYRVGFREPPEINHIEAQVLGLVAKLYPEVFATLDRFFARHQDYRDPVVHRFDREVQFYVSYLEYIRQFKAVGLAFCYPQVTRKSKALAARETFDLALANKLIGEQSTVVTNDFFLEGPERIIVVSGPNQGGKTTFARMFGQLHHLAGIGYLVPGREARLYLYDELFVQFEREETLTNMTGKLEDDLVRVKDTLSRATPDSVVVLNEIFASTTLQDSVFLGTKVMEKLIELDLLAVFVTFVEELASLAPSTVSMVSTIVPENPAERTYKVVRKPADGLAFALAIAEKYKVAYEQLKKRVSS